MSESIKGFETPEGVKQYDYEALTNKPTLVTQSNISEALEQAKQYTREEIAKIDVAPDINLDSYATTEWVQSNYQVKGNYVTSENLETEINQALTEAKNNGDFKGEPGDDYILTESDKNEIADIVLDQIDIPESGGGTADLTGYATIEWVQSNYQVKDNYLTDSSLQDAVNSALAQAKESGEFDGAPGATPVKGTDYFTQTEINEIVAAAAESVLAQLTDVSKVGA